MINGRRYTKKKMRNARKYVNFWQNSVWNRQSGADQWSVLPNMSWWNGSGRPKSSEPPRTQRPINTFAPLGKNWSRRGGGFGWSLLPSKKPSQG